MADLAELKTQLEKVQKDLAEMQKEADKAAKLEKELAETKKLVEAYKVSSKTVYVNKEKKLQKFSGRPVKDTDLTVEEWIEDAVYHLKSISDKDSQVEFIYDHLIGPAKDEVRIRPESERNTPSKMLDILRLAFEDAETVAQLQQRFYQRNQNSDESLQSYSLVLMKLVDRMVKKDKANLGDKDLMLTERFIDGVRDQQLRRKMRRYTFEQKGMAFTDFRQMVLKWTEDEIVTRKLTSSVSTREATTEVEVNPESNEQRFRSADSKKKEPVVDSEIMKLFQSQQDILQKQQQQIDMLTQLVQQEKAATHRSRGPRSKPSVCFQCQGHGHFARDCPTKGSSKKSANAVDKKEKDGDKIPDGQKRNLNK